MDAMEELDGMDILTGSNPALPNECHVLGKGVLPGLRYRHLGKSGLKVGKHLSQSKSTPSLKSNSKVQVKSSSLSPSQESKFKV